MRFLLRRAARFGLIGLAGFGTLAGAKLTLEHLQHGEICPVVGPIPACIIVFFGYLLMLVSAILLGRRISKPAFYGGWTPVFLLAFIGVTLELVKGQTCPPGVFGIPQCFFSLAMVLACLGLFKFSRKTVAAA